MRRRMRHNGGARRGAERHLPSRPLRGAHLRHCISAAKVADRDRWSCTSSHAALNKRKRGARPSRTKPQLPSSTPWRWLPVRAPACSWHCSQPDQRSPAAARHRWLRRVDRRRRRRQRQAARQRPLLRQRRSSSSRRRRGACVPPTPPASSRPRHWWHPPRALSVWRKASSTGRRRPVRWRRRRPRRQTPRSASTAPTRACPRCATRCAPRSAEKTGCKG